LVVVSGHVTDEEKKDYVVQLLDTLKKENLNLCYVTHASNYLEELSKRVDFLYYDKNNLLMSDADYLTHSNLLDATSYNYGVFYRWNNLPFGKVIMNTIVKHGPAVVILTKNAIDIANSNHFKWIVFIEYDIILPKNGFAQFIRDKLALLISNNKKCLLYQRPDAAFIYPGILIFTPEDILTHSMFLKTDWYSSAKNWISTWKLGFSETVIQNILTSVFKNDILEYNIAEDAKQYWGVDHYSKLHIYSQAHTQPVIRLIPHKQDENFLLNVFISNIDHNTLHISNLTVYNKSNNSIIYNITNKTMNAGEWWYFTLTSTLYDSTDIIELQYTSNINGMTTEKLSYDMKYIDNIYNYICRFESN
jgi:hypothetical protein